MLFRKFKKDTHNSDDEIIDKKTILIFSHTPLIAHFFLREHIKELSQKFNIILAHNTYLDRYCPNVSDLCKIETILIQRKISFFFDFLAIFQIIKLIKKYKPQAVISVAPKAGFFSMPLSNLLGIRKRLHIFQGEVWPNKTGIKKKILMFCDNVIIKNSTNLLCVSKSEKDLLKSNFLITTNKLHVLGYGTICGIKEKFFKTYKNHKQKKKNIKNCVYLGRICIEKGIRDLIKAFSLLDHTTKDKKLILIGPEENFSVYNEVKFLPKEIQKNIKLIPFTNNPETFLSQADFLCLPSYREGFPLSIIEAGAMGIPSVGSKIVGIIDAIDENKTGLLFEPKNIEGLSNCLNIMFNNNALRRKLGREARIRSKKFFKQKTVVSLYTNYISKLM